MLKIRFNVKNFAINVCLLLGGVVLFTLPQPNLLTVNGLPFLVYIALIPVFLLVRRASWKTVWLYGIAYGALCYCFYTYWLADFHPMGMVVIASLFAFHLMFAFPIFKAVAVLFPKWGWLMQWIVWCGYEYIKTLGFSGFHYGVTGYSQWQSELLMQCVDIVGIWGLSALVCFPSGWITGAIVAHLRGERGWIRRNLIPAGCWGLIFISAIVYGVFARVDYSKDKTVTVALIQPNSDPWIGGIDAYRRDLQTLKQLSSDALTKNPLVDFVVWPETAFIPRIEWHYKYRAERDKFELVEDLLTYLDAAPVPYILGNDDAVMGFTRSGTHDAVDYNAVLAFTPKKNVVPPQPKRYRKMHLVPFTEHFPFEKIFPTLYELLLNGDTHMWEPGTEPTVFTVAGLSFGTPICFEDTFGYIARRFVNNGAQALVNLSNDAWSKSLACQYQHLSMAVFRSVENRIPSVRSTASGQTAIIDPNGKVTAMAKPFEQTYLVGTIPIRDMTKKTLYTKLGDFVGVFFLTASLVIVLAGIILKAWKKHHR